MPSPGEPPALPSDPRQHDGVQYPDACWDEEEFGSFFAIGDWGGFCSYPNFDPENPTRNMCREWNQVKGAFHPGDGIVFENMPQPAEGMYHKNGFVDRNAQVLVADKMIAMHKNLSSLGQPPRFVISVGDNFYPGGIEDHCSNKGSGDMPAIVEQYQFKAIFEDVYDAKNQDLYQPGAESFNDLEWWGVLGNHDYGGVCVIKAWDQMILYTWKENGRWVIPAPYWRRRVQFKRFDIDFFFIDSNVINALGMDVDDHNLCNGGNNNDADTKKNWCRFSEHADKREFYPPTKGAGNSCPNAGAANVNADTCSDWFHSMWSDTKKWLDDGLAKSEADWQVLVSHFPVRDPLPGIEWMDYVKTNGLDLVITGHQHFQKIYHNKAIEDAPSVNLGETIHVITGGGGGIQTDETPRADGFDSTYGYMVFNVSIQTLEVQTWTHGGKLLKDGGKQIMWNRTVGSYVDKSTAPELTVSV